MADTWVVSIHLPKKASGEVSVEFHVSGVSCYPALFVFGDSLSDTCNSNLTGNSFFKRTTEAPYGETVPGFPFNRFSDGLHLVDFLGRQNRSYRQILVGIDMQRLYFLYFTMGFSNTRPDLCIVIALIRMPYCKPLLI
ncbi:hypothetical protein KP509_08G009000 [Ceratopteris richardii]|uniref:GDSL esterase/lipase n=1 Tax=Ceratopteris richardii TaxID=49495 RepID=A0A8T2U5Q8_CERRI|nr:hypothetical protein KP509_08G009000 [Ceratopteris richardii]